MNQQIIQLFNFVIYGMILFANWFLFSNIAAMTAFQEKVSGLAG